MCIIHIYVYIYIYAQECKTGAIKQDPHIGIILERLSLE